MDQNRVDIQLEPNNQTNSNDENIEVKKKDDLITKIKRNLPILLTVVVALLALISTVVVIVLETGSEVNRDLGECSEAHEGYNLTSEATLGVYSQFALAVDNKICSTVGKDIFQKGGSVVDAAIAAGLCNSVMNGHSMGLGGGHFMTIYLKEQNKSYVIDARDVAPINSYRDMFVGKELDNGQRLGGLYTAVPGEIYGYWKAHTIGGKLAWRDLFEPTIRLCEDGFPMSKSMASAARSRLTFIRKNKAISDLLIDPVTNSSYAEGQIVKWPNLARTLRVVSEKGYQAIYDGELTPIIVNEINQNGGNMTLDDFRLYQPRVYENTYVIRIDENLRAYTVPPPSSGVLVTAIMRIMRKFQLEHTTNMTSDDWNVFYHRLTETFKHVYAKRFDFGDNEYVDELIRELTDENFIESVVSKIDDKRTFPTSYYGLATGKIESGTAHLSILAPNGDAVSLTSSVNSYFGAKYAGEQTGIIYSDTMDDFSSPGVTNSYGYAPSEANFIVPGKRPLSSMSPTIVVDNQNRVRLIVGASGGSKIITAIAQVAIKTLFMGVDLKTAIDDRRVHHQLIPTYAEIEEDFPITAAQHLRKIGHYTSCFAFGGSTVQGIQVFDNRIDAYSDPRKGGGPDGV